MSAAQLTRSRRGFRSWFCAEGFEINQAVRCRPPGAGTAVTERNLHLCIAARNRGIDGGDHPFQRSGATLAIERFQA
jgi:hypothetical protein